MGHGSEDTGHVPRLVEGLTRMVKSAPPPAYTSTAM